MENYKRNIKTSQRLEYGFYQFLDHFFGRKRVFKVFGKRRNTFYKNLEKTLEKSGEGRTFQIERRKELTLREFRRNYLIKGIPVIIEGAAKDWDCVRDWSFDYFKDLHGSDEVVLSVEGDRSKFEIMTLADIIDNVNSGGSKYYRFYPLLKRHPEHIRDFDYRWLKERKNNFTLFEEFRVFMGGKGTTTPLHNEDRGNLFVQVYGDKKWILYPPYYTSVIDPLPVKNAYRGVIPKNETGNFEPLKPNYAPPYNMYKYIDQYETLLKPGDVLWVPTFYWHTVENTTNSIGVGYRWFNPFTPFVTAPLYMFLNFFATKPPIWNILKLSKEDINLLLVAEGGSLDKYRREMEERSKMKDVKLKETSI